MNTSIVNSGALLAVFAVFLGSSLFVAGHSQAQSPYGSGGTGSGGASGAQSGGAKLIWDFTGAQVTVTQSGPNSFTVSHDGTGVSYVVTIGGLSGQYVTGGDKSYTGDGKIGNSVESGLRQLTFDANGNFTYYKEPDAALLWNGGGIGAYTTESEQVYGYYGTFIGPGNGKRAIAFFCSNGFYSMAELSSSDRQISSLMGSFTKY